MPIATVRRMETADHRLRQAREARGFETASAAAQAMGVPVATYVQHENGSRGFPAKRAQQYGRFFGVTPEWLLYGRGDAPRSGAKATPSADAVPLLGYIGAGDAAHYYDDADDPRETVPRPETNLPIVGASEIRGPSLGRMFEGWLVFFGDRQDHVSPDMIGELCAVGLPDGRVLVKQIQSGRFGRYHLISATEPPMFDEEIVWAAKVNAFTRR